MSTNRKALYENNAVAKALSQKWGWMLEGIENDQVRINTAMLLEMEHQRGGLITEDTGTYSGQTANATGFDFSAADGTGAGVDVAPFQHYLLPLVRRVYPNLIANELVGVQPMTSPASLVFYLKYRYTGMVDPDVVTTVGGLSRTHHQAPIAKGNTAAGTEYGNFSGNTWAIDPYYSLQTIYRESVFDATTLTAVTDDGSLAANALVASGAAINVYPIIANTLSVGVVGTSTISFVVENATNASTATVLYTLSSYVASTGVATFTYTSTTFLTGTGVLTTAPTGAALTFTVTFSPTTGLVTATSALDLTAVSLDAQLVDEFKAGTVSNLHRTYDYNMEGNRQLPEMELQVESFPVTAKTRKLRTKWTIEAAQDLRAMHNIDAEQELIAVLANEVTAEIDREIINDLIVNAHIRVDYDYSNPFLVGGAFTAATADAAAGGTATFVVGGSSNFDDRNKSLFYQILEVSNQIYRQSLRGAGNWVVTSPEVAAKLESLNEFRPDARTDTSYNLGIVYSGTLNGQFKVYKDPLFPTNLILVGYKGSSFMDAGFFYCPYVPLQLTPTVLDTESFNPRKGLITRYGKVIVENGNRMYAVIRVTNITAMGANRLPGSDSVGTQPQINGTTMGASAAGSSLI